MNEGSPHRPLDPLEIASGLLHGAEDGWSALTDETTASPREALEQAVLQGLERAPCIVSFSGGRDSSAVLAVATHVARSHGLADPIPVSLRFRRVATADEADWQEMVVQHLGLQDWDRCYLDEQMDVLGPFAQQVLQHHGLLWPLNAHFHLPVVDRAAGGSLLTGVGGDEVLLPSDWARVNRVRAGSTSRRPLDPIRLLVASGPPALRARWFRRKLGSLDMPWLRKEAQRGLLVDFARDAAAEPVAWDRWLREAWWPHRTRVVGASSLAKLATTRHVRLVQPLEDPAFLAALARTHGAEGFSSRTQAMQELFGDLLPAALISRRTKSWFDAAFMAQSTREFAAAWDGSGVDAEVVNQEALAAMWRSDDIDPRSLLLLQHVWHRRATPTSALRTRPALVVRGPRPRGPMPNFFVVGAAKAGTSALHSILQQHPDVWLGRMKEPHYFAWRADPNLVGPLFSDPTTAESQYLGYFEGADGSHFVGDCSTSSLVVPGTAARIREASPEARIVIILRDPTERALSHFVHFASAGAETTRDFGEAVLRSGTDRAREDLPFTYDYLGWSRYGDRLAEYLDTFGADRVHVELHEEFLRDPGGVAARIVTFLGAATFSPVPGRRVNQMRMARWPALTNVVYGRTNGGRRLQSVLPRAVVTGARERLRPHLYAKPTLHPDVRARIVESLSDDVQTVERLTGRNLSHWRTL